MRFKRGDIVLVGSRGVYVVTGRCACGSATCHDLAPLKGFGDLYHQQGASISARVPRPDDEQRTRAEAILAKRTR